MIRYAGRLRRELWWAERGSNSPRVYHRFYRPARCLLRFICPCWCLIRESNPEETGFESVMSAGCINQTNGTPAAIRTLMAGLEDRCTIPCATGALWLLVGGLNSVSAGYEPARYADSRAIGVRGGSRTRKTCILSAVPVPNSVTRTSRNGLPGGDRTRITRILSAVRMPFPAPGEYGVPTRIRTGNQTLLRRLRMPFRHRDKWSSVQEVPFLHTAPRQS